LTSIVDLDQLGRQPRGSVVFLDRDGVINANRADHVVSWDQFTFLPRALKGLSLLHAAGVPVIVVTNQAIIGKGTLSVTALDDIHARMCAAVLAKGGSILDVLYCPHVASANCECRKPKPGLLQRGAEKYGFDLTSSFYVGDALSDLTAGQATGCRCVLVTTGRGRTQVLREEARFLRNYQTVDNLLAAARWILAQGRGTGRLQRFRTGAK
jgi:D-glycero-D-manno-heptose 1,7-bisphosphate phosphatase